MASTWYFKASEILLLTMQDGDVIITYVRDDPYKLVKKAVEAPIEIDDGLAFERVRREPIPLPIKRDARDEDDMPF